MSVNHYFKCIEYLKQLSVPYFLQRTLQDDYFSQDYEKSINTRINNLDKTIESFCNKKKLKIQDIGKAHTQQTDFGIIAKECSLYFKQGEEMLSMSQNMTESTGPLVEYYGFLQCVKGVVLTHVNFNRQKIFTRHGISEKSSSDQYINAKIQPYGVFHALCIFFNKIDDYLANDYTIGLKYLIESQLSNITETFIGSWMLSTLVRYKPKIWIEMIEGNTDDLIIKIRKFREITIPNAIQDLLQQIYVSGNIFGNGYTPLDG